MSTFLLVISFIIDGVIILTLLTISTRVEKNEELEMRQEEVAREIEDMFTSYLMEIKEENKRMSSWLQPEKHSINDQKTEGGKAIVDESISSKHYKVKSSEEHTNYSPPLSNEGKDFFERSDNYRILELRRVGYSVDEIAKKLDRGKTEIELFIKFEQKH
ncbi:hypothetical protein CEH05_10245 [Halobacillus halophilus]|uniref:Uncharacterized protein n=1 Tax=Halobacillus halophilus (strain ATCC 35676 / DSM 2266 / JCM 20832 / KCTC 3685 / LMG 17431 / NBRC 102448 / NCIMB 2269) TaxID=866895 RepID=I0JMP0_HALH3|nr:hypothetical protein [Halobacillus halophilus]ASF39488.1 hypothetical protein CEH05_10245 [Halobacillus halophilus]CCG45410.1 hypothetical protein HBHAL_3063 [Halobacillus halophilus DSM 2266]